MVVMKQYTESSDVINQQAKAPHVLVVDDNADLADTMCFLLESMDCRVQTVYHPVKALAISQENKFDFFLLDIGLPEINGYELIEMLRERQKNPEAVFLAFSAYDGKAYREKSLAVGFKCHFVKPTDINKIIVEIAKSPKFRIR